MYKKSKLLIDLDGAEVNYSSTEERANFKRLYFDNCKDYYKFKVWVKDNLDMYNPDLGDYDDVPPEHILIYLNHLKVKFKNIVDRPHWYKALSSIERYAIRLKKLNLEGEDDE